MSSKPDGRNFEDQETIDVHDEEAVRYWTAKLGVGEKQLRETVAKVGITAHAVAHMIGK